MTQKAEFNAEEWTLILEGAPTAAMIVIAAGKGGTIRESMSIGKAYAAEQQNPDSTELLDAIVNDRPSLDVKRYEDPADLATVGLTRVKAAVDTLAAKGTAIEAEDFKRFIYAVALNAAEAHKEGGFLGIGGTRVSEQEAEALQKLAETIGYDAPPLGEGEGTG
jgi:hypothetical protein